MQTLIVQNGSVWIQNKKQKCISVDYWKGDKGYRLQDPNVKNAIINRDVVFSVPMLKVKNAQQNEMFSAEF